jgi:AcrR family transcriptional regulator
MSNLVGSGKANIGVKAGAGKTEEKRRRILAAVRPLFLRYGFKRVTMDDLAAAAGISRPALYLVFPKKERLFSEFVLEVAGELAAGLKQRLPGVRAPVDKLKLVFDFWFVRPFELIARTDVVIEVLHSIKEFAPDADAALDVMIEADLASVLRLFPKRALPKGATPRQLAHVLRLALMGLQRFSKDSRELRRVINDLVALTIRL